MLYEVTITCPSLSETCNRQMSLPSVNLKKKNKKKKTFMLLMELSFAT